MTHGLTKAQLTFRLNLFEFWADGYMGRDMMDGGKPSDLSFVFFAKFIEEMHPDLVLNDAERNLCATMNRILPGELSSSADAESAAFLKRYEHFPPPLVRAYFHGKVLRDFAAAISRREGHGGQHHAN